MPNKQRQGKWQPYDALIGFQQSLRNAEFEQEKIPKPVLFPDQAEELNFRLVNACDAQKQIRITYYQSGHLYQLEGRPEKLDSVARELKIKNQKIKLNDIVDIVEIE
jgi:hypothetical protein